MEECNLHTIVRLPNSVFQPYATVATNLLFFEKGKKTKEVWYYEHKLPDGQKAYNKTRPIRLEEFEPIKEWWNNRHENDVSWKVGIKSIIESGYDLDVKNPKKQEDVHEYTCAELIKLLGESMENSKDLLNQLSDSLK